MSGTPSSASDRPGFRSLLALSLAVSVLAGCAEIPPPAPAAPDRQLVEERRRLETERQQLDADRQQLDATRKQIDADRQQLDKDHRQLEEALRKQTAASQDIEDRQARQRLQLLERDMQIKALTQKLDAAITEVVRSMAKLRSLESKAEAASTLAEAEIAYKALGRDPGREKDADLIQAEQLLKLGAQEFRKENYGGVLYLTSQAKTLIKGGQVRSPGAQNLPRVDGEIPFAVPLPLRALNKGNVREGPGPSFKVAFVVEQGTPLTGKSYKGLWVRVRGDDGRWGWIAQNLVGER